MLGNVKVEPALFVEQGLDDGFRLAWARRTWHAAFTVGKTSGFRLFTVLDVGCAWHGTYLERNP